MGFVSFVNNLGGKVSDAGHRLGKQIHHGLHQGALKKLVRQNWLWIER